MRWTIEAIYTGGVLRPAADLELREGQRVRVTIDVAEERDRPREEAVARLKAGIASMGFAAEERPPNREELHDQR
jgi:predicted DNA-binding antitoxin AbrB/MazE fold protein